MYKKSDMKRLYNFIKVKITPEITAVYSNNDYRYICIICKTNNWNC